MVAWRYGISLLVFNSIWRDIALNTRREIPYLRTPCVDTLYLSPVFHCNFVCAPPAATIDLIVLHRLMGATQGNRLKLCLLLIISLLFNWSKTHRPTQRHTKPLSCLQILSETRHLGDLFSVILRDYLFLINRARGPYWENIARGLCGIDRAKGGPYKKDRGQHSPSTVPS